MSGGASRLCVEKKLHLLRIELRAEWTAEIESLRKEFTCLKTDLLDTTSFSEQNSKAISDPNAPKGTALDGTQLAKHSGAESSNAAKSHGEVAKKLMASQSIVPEPLGSPVDFAPTPPASPPPPLPNIEARDEAVLASSPQIESQSKKRYSVKDAFGKIAQQAQRRSSVTDRFGLIASQARERIAKEMERVNLVPVPFEDSVWNIVLALGLSNASSFERCVSMVVLLFNVFLQLAFVSAVSNTYFLGESLSEEIEAGKDWRTAFAHDATYLDLRHTSLAARVCQQSSSLNVASHQVELIEGINMYLGLEPDEFDGGRLGPGAVLSLACISLWFISIWTELRQIALVLQAVQQIPRKNNTMLLEGEFLTISRSRLIVFYFVGALRILLASWLLVAGIIWLGVTTSIQDLILNAVALKAILDLDEIMFSALMPERIQNRVQCLDCVNVHVTSRRTFWESIVFFSSTFAVLLVSYFLLIEDLVDTMVRVKQNLCGGNLNFIMATNTHTQLMFGHVTSEVSDDEDFTLQQKAVSSSIKIEDLRAHHSVGLLIFDAILDTTAGKAPSALQLLRRFKNNVKMDMVHLTSLQRYTNSTVCADYDDSQTGILSNDPLMSVAWKVLLETNQYSSLINIIQNKSGVITCADFGEFCNEESARLLRLVCPVSCACGVPNTVLMFRTQKYGCKLGCSRFAVEEGICADNQLPYSTWSLFWDVWANHSSFYWGSASAIDQTAGWMKNDGCLGLNDIPNDLEGNYFCSGQDCYDPLRVMCPLVCGCHFQRLSGCPDNCAKGPACADSPFLPSDLRANTCAEAAALGRCSMKLSEYYCPATCSKCPSSFTKYTSF